jgi:hypothetical protein
MLADFFTKPLQGKRFQFLRDLILNIQSAAVHRSMLVDNNTEDALLQSGSRQNPINQIYLIRWRERERERESREEDRE